MLFRVHRALAAIALGLLGAGTSLAQTQTVGLFQNDPGAFEGYTLFASLGHEDTYLINNEGRLVNAWTGDNHLTGAMGYLLENGHLLRSARDFETGWFLAGGQAGLVQEFDWDGTLLWEFSYSDSLYRSHHDIATLPNGNVLVLAWELKTFDEAVAAGRNPALIPEGEVWPEHIIEVERVGATGGNIVWEWHIWDHLIQDFDSTKANYGVVADHPELMDINYVFGSGPADWLHANAINYNAELDQIVMSLNSVAEFWIIDHGTTTEEAAGHTGGARGMGGDILYRWGNPEVYDRGTVADTKFYRQHDVQWIAPGLPGEGNILIYNNGNGRPGGNHSTVEEIVTTVDANGDYPVPAPGVPHGPADALWVYAAAPPESLYSPNISGAQRLPNGNTLICEGNPSGRLHEVDPLEDRVWFYVCPVDTGGPMMQGDPVGQNRIFRALRYAPEYPGLAGRDLTPGAPIEIYPTTGVDVGPVAASPFFLSPSSPNPFRSTTNITMSLSQGAAVELTVYDVMGRRVATLVDRSLDAGVHEYSWNALGLPAGVYHSVLQVGEEKQSRKMVVVR